MKKARFLNFQREIHHLKSIIRKQKHEINLLSMLNNRKQLLIQHYANQNKQIHEFDINKSNFTNRKTFNVIKDLLKNLPLHPNARNYTIESKLFYLSLFEKSADAYNWLAKVFPVPCESNLRKTFTNMIKEKEYDLLSLENLPQVISKINPPEDIDTVLSVDAFSSTILMKISESQKSDKKNDEIFYNPVTFNNDNSKSEININSEKNNFQISIDDNNNTKLNSTYNNISNEKENRFSIHFNKYECSNVFIFLLLPFRVDIKPQIIFLKPSKSGSANEEINSIISIILKHLKKSRFKIKCISCDGDRFYSKFFEKQFNFNYSIIKDKSFELFIIEFSKLEEIWISDPLHLFKNGRTRIMNNNVIINPFIESSYFNSEEINEILELGSILTDRSAVGKMRDVYPTSLFTFNNSIKLFRCGKFEAFVYIFLYSLWNECLLNKKNWQWHKIISTFNSTANFNCFI